MLTVARRFTAVGTVPGPRRYLRYAYGCPPGGPGGRAVTWGHRHPRRPQETGHSRAVGAGTLHRDPGHRPEASQPAAAAGGGRFSTLGQSGSSTCGPMCAQSCASTL